jgi:hypothetical protein
MPDSRGEVHVVDDQNSSGSYWDWVWSGPLETYCGRLTALSEPEEQYILSLRGMVPLWLAEDAPCESIRFRCPLSPGHEGPHLTHVGEVDLNLAESVTDEESDWASWLTSWYLVWGPDEVEPRSITPKTSCEKSVRDAEQCEWSCCLPAGHGGVCRFNIQQVVEIEEYGLDLDLDDEHEPRWLTESQRELVDYYLAGEGSYRELAELNGMSSSALRSLVLSTTTQEERSEAQKRRRAKSSLRRRARLALIASEEARVAAARTKVLQAP